MKRKLNSRKLWAACAGFIAGQIAALNPKNPPSVRIAGLAVSGASAVSYIFGESRADAAGAVPLILPPCDASDDDTEDIPEVGAEEQ
jgi:hypothetical protein